MYTLSGGVFSVYTHFRRRRVRLVGNYTIFDFFFFILSLSPAGNNNTHDARYHYNMLFYNMVLYFFRSILIWYQNINTRRGHHARK